MIHVGSAVIPVGYHQHSFITCSVTSLLQLKSIIVLIGILLKIDQDKMFHIINAHAER